MSVSTVHPAYAAMVNSWAILRDAYAGASAVKGATAPRRASRGSTAAGTRYLPRPPGMLLDEQYDLYRDRATFGDFTAVVVNGMGGAIFRREPVVEAPEILTPQLEDVTQTGVPLRTFAEQVVRETLLMGRFGVLVDFPQAVITETGVTAPPANPRPYWIAYPCEEILNWRTMQRQGDTVLSLVVLKECVPVPQGVWPSPDFFIVQDQIQYRVLRLNEFGQYEVSLWVEQPTSRAQRPAVPTLLDVWIPLREGTPLDFIPFVFMAPFSLEPAVEKSLMEGLVEVNFRYYRHSADYEQALFLTAMPTPYVCSTSLEPQTQLLIGSYVAWVIPDSTAKVGLLQPDAAGLPAHQIAIETDKRDMAALGARLLESPAEVTETRIAAASRTQGAESPMQSLITTVSQGLTQALQIHTWWAGYTDDPDDTAVTMSLNKDIVANTMPPQMLTALMQALLNNAISYDTFWYNLQKGEIARPMVDAEEEQDLIDLRQQQQPLIAPTRQPFGGGPGQPPSPPPGQNGAARTAA